MVSERRTQRGRLGVRLTAIILAIAAPIIVSAVLFSYLQTGEQAREESLERLRAVNRSLSSSVSVWRTLNVQSLQQLATLPDIVSMDARRQKPILEAMGAAHPHMYLISTTDMAGLNVARNDAAEPKDYSDRNWFLAARDGAPLTFQSLIGRTSGEPALVASMPIRDAGGEIVGVGMFASDLSVIAQEVQASQLGETGSAYVIDAVNLVIAHPDPAYSAELRDLGSYPPVAALREGRTGPLSFSDDNGVRWAAYVDTLDHGWGVIVQQQESELTSALRQTQTVTWIATAIGVVLLGFVASLAVRQALLPIGSLTETAGAITSGDLTRIAPVESEDEIGMLANAFNSMTTQLNEYIGTLEQRVAVRTRDLERRARYLEASAAVAREAASVLEPQELLDRVTTLISDHFGFYHAGIFLLDETGEWAVLQAASSEGGRRMLARSHRLPVGEVGIVGYVTGQGEPRVVLDVDQDTIYFDNPDMPDTRSEMALPLQVRGQIIGALDVQSREARAFTDEDVEVLQALADQVAIAISNAQLLQQAQASLDAERRAYGEVTRDAWLEMIRARSAAGYRSDEMGVTAVDAGSAERHDGEVPELAIPIQVRGQIIGTVKARKPDEQSEWNPDDLALMETLTDQLEQALESARLYQDTQLSAERERLIGEITARIRERLDMESVVKTAAQEIRQALGVPELTVRLAARDSNGDTSGSE
jgi:GAF domain-containing protein/HAMP domain-containing protein